MKKDFNGIGFVKKFFYTISYGALDYKQYGITSEIVINEKPYKVIFVGEKFKKFFVNDLNMKLPVVIDGHFVEVHSSDGDANIIYADSIRQKDTLISGGLKNHADLLEKQYKDM